MRALITGINGFVGKHLSQHLREKGVEVFGIVHPHEGEMPSQRENIFVADIRSRGSLKRIIDIASPDVVFHLAARAFVPAAREDPRDAVETNIIGSLNVMEAVRQRAPEAKVILAGSSGVYGRVKAGDLPITEDNAVAPVNLYAATKASMELTARVYSIDFDLRIITLRLFNHIGPGQDRSFVCSNFAMQIARIERGEQKPVICVGNLEAKRDFTDVRDVAHAYYLAGQKADASCCYNVSSGQARSIDEMLQMLRGLAKVEFKVKRETSRLRRTDIPVLVGSSERFRDTTGWKPEIAIEKTLADILDWWRIKLDNA